MGINLTELKFRYLADLSYCSQLNYVRQQWYCYKWLKKRIKWKDQLWDVENVYNNQVEPNSSIFVYWKQGWDSAPKLVKKCAESLRQHAGKHPIIFLDESNIHKYVSFPSHIDKFHEDGTIKEALFSDMLRISLLVKYGGIWCDATCLWTDSLPDYIETAPFFMFQNSKLPEWASPIKGSNWFLKSCKDNVLLGKIRNFLFTYYSNKTELINYYIFHLILAVLADNDLECKSILERTPYVCNMNPHVLQFSFGEVYSEQRLKQITDQSFIHKLSYKYSDELLVSPNNILNYILRDDIIL